MCAHRPVYAGVDHGYTALTMHTHTAGQKTFAASFKYKIVVEGLQTLTKHVLSSENTYRASQWHNSLLYWFRHGLRSLTPVSKMLSSPSVSLASFPIIKLK